MVRSVFWSILITGSFSLLLAQPGGGAPLVPLNPPPAPQANPITPAKTFLGKALFWDEQMSSTGTAACGTCHKPGAGGSDPRPLAAVAARANPGVDGIYGNEDDVIGSPGVPLHFDDGTYAWNQHFNLDPQVTGRKSPPALNAAYPPELFWDGRAGRQFLDPDTGAVILNNGGALENQVLGPPLSDAEMGHVNREWDDVVARIGASQPLALAESVPTALANWIGDRGYPALFQEAFGSSDITAARIAMAIATYERVLFTDQTPLDEALSGGEPLTELERQGMAVFVATNCDACHGGPLLADNRFHYIGLRPNDEDEGRFAETGDPEDLGAFRTASLRNIALRAPYFHNGRFDSLEEVVEFYDRGGDFDANNLANQIRPLNLDDNQKAALVAFMRRPLTDPRVAAGLAPFDPPTLYADSSRVPVIEGTGRAGSGNLEPRAIALEPPIAGNDSFTVAVTDGLGGASAVLVIDDRDPGVTADIPTSGTFAYREITLQGSGTGQGYGSVSLQIDGGRSPADGQFFGRWYVRDNGADGGVAVTPVFRFSVFRAASESWCGTDFDGDRTTSVLDLAFIVNDTRPCPVPCAGDIDASGAVDGADLTQAVSSWSGCP
ncbi:Di-haem cytochrome c peroxidase [Sulfidibacter corallicola]|uniref:Cytochrome c domain-containing protein n=1 Tax=Sulfidibacter corallicola TaxID=2818388 RepID=A0A8A4TIZ6_SULCO|nr:cytochrome c peroxidase [Sulfidibacter corallicola]QTD48821.1 hypothetical protein J3U87_24835 [Sulfidibacter corallicola]